MSRKDTKLHKYVSVTYDQLNKFLDFNQAKAGKKPKTIVARAALLAAYDNIHQLPLNGLDEEILKQATLKKVIVPHCLKNIKTKDYEVFPIGNIAKAVTKEIIEHVETEFPDGVMENFEQNPPHRNVLETRLIAEIPAEYEVTEDTPNDVQTRYAVVHVYDGETLGKVDGTSTYETEEEAFAVAREKALTEETSLAVVQRLEREDGSTGATVFTRTLTKPAKVTVAHKIVLSDELKPEEYLVLLPYRPFG